MCTGLSCDQSREFGCVIFHYDRQDNFDSGIEMFRFHIFRSSRIPNVSAEGKGVVGGGYEWRSSCGCGYSWDKKMAKQQYMRPAALSVSCSL